MLYYGGAILKEEVKRKIGDLVEVFGEPAVEIASELIFDGAQIVLGTAIPGAASIFMNIKQKRFEKNICKLLADFQNNIDDLQEKFSIMSDVRKNLFKNDLSAIIIDYVSDERDVEKISYIVNGIKNLMDENKNIDNTSLYFDVLKNLRNSDILLLKRYVFGSGDNDISFTDFLQTLGIDYDECNFIKNKLVRNGLLESNYDTEQAKIIDYLYEISKLFTALEKKGQLKLTNSIKRPKFKKIETLRISKLGRAFISFFAEYKNE